MSRQRFRDVEFFVSTGVISSSRSVVSGVRTYWVTTLELFLVCAVCETLCPIAQKRKGRQRHLPARRGQQRGLFTVLLVWPLVLRSLILLLLSSSIPKLPPAAVGTAAVDVAAAFILRWRLLQILRLLPLRRRLRLRLRLRLRRGRPAAPPTTTTTTSC